MSTSKNSMQVLVRLKGSLKEKFVKIKDDLGVQSDAEVVRYVIKKFPFPEA